MVFQPQAILDDLSKTGTISALDQSVELDLYGVSGGKAVISGTWIGTIKFEGMVAGQEEGHSLDRWDSIGTFSGTTGAILGQTGITSNDIVVFVGIAGLKKIRVRFHAYTSGSAIATIRGSNGVSNVFVDNLITANLKTQSNTHDGSSNPINSTVLNNRRGLDNSPTSFPPGSNYVRISTVTTTVVSSSSGNLRKIIINDTIGATGLATIYDNTSGTGTIIASIKLAGDIPTTLSYDLKFNTGLTIVTTGTIGNITVVYD